MKLWIDDIRTKPDGYIWIKTVDSAIYMIQKHWNDIELIDLDHDAGVYEHRGGDYIKILDYLESVQTEIPFTFTFHTANPVGRANMIRICQKNGWRIL